MKIEHLQKDIIWGRPPDPGVTHEKEIVITLSEYEAQELAIVIRRGLPIVREIQSLMFGLERILR
jgi:hypothetical protein